MTYAKKELFPRRFQEISAIARSFYHPARLAILDHLAKERRVLSGDLCEKIPLSRETVSHHLQELVKAGLIRGAFAGKHIYYRLDPENVLDMGDKLHRFIQELVARTISNENL